jgi:hypothetical protein
MHLPKRKSIMKNHYLLLILCLVLSACSAPGLTGQPQAGTFATPFPSQRPPTMPVLLPDETDVPSPQPGQPAHVVDPSLPPEVIAQQLMLYSHERWSTLFADAVVNRYPAEGYGPAQTLRVQTWIRLPAQARWESGPAEGAPDTYWISDGVNIRDGDNPLTPAPESLQAPFHMTIAPDTINGYPLAGVMGGPLMDMLFPTGLAQRGGYYTFIGKEAIAGRQAYLVEWRYMPDTPTDRLWVDAQTGVVLRQQNYGKSGSQTPVSDIFVTRIEFDSDIPPEVFDVNQPRPAGWGIAPEGSTPATQPPSQPGQVFASVLKSDLGYINVRSGPGTGDYEVIGTLSFGQSVPVTGRNAGGDWWQIDYNNQTGWVWAELLEVSGDPSNVPVVPTPTPAMP